MTAMRPQHMVGKLVTLIKKHFLARKYDRTFVWYIKGRYMDSNARITPRYDVSAAQQVPIRIFVYFHFRHDFPTLYSPAHVYTKV